MAKYKLVDSSTVLNEETKMFIPLGGGVTGSYKEYVLWLAESNVPDAREPIIPPDTDNSIEYKKVIKKLRRIIQTMRTLHPEIKITMNFDDD